jgi:hypothetical protein
MAQLNYMGNAWNMPQWNQNMNGSNASLNIPNQSQGYYPNDQQMFWGQPGMYPYPMQPNMNIMGGKFSSFAQCFSLSYISF